MELSKLESTLVGVSGEYFVAAELSLRGYLASMTLRNSRGIDIIVSNSDASHSVSVQVKTSKKGAPRWILTKKAETFMAKNHFYVFVLLHSESTRPDYYVVPSKVVAEHCQRTHADWLAGKKKDGSFRKDSSVRVFEDKVGKYKERWDVLGLSTSAMKMSGLAERMADFKPVVLTPCQTCRHRISGFTCAAYPKRIPQEILTGENLHREPYEGDHGIQWAAVLNKS